MLNPRNLREMRTNVISMRSYWVEEGMRRSISLEVGRTKGPSIASELSNQSNTRLILAASYSESIVLFVRSSSSEMCLEIRELRLASSVAAPIVFKE